MAPQPIHVFPRAGDGSSSTGLYVAGFVVAGVVLMGAAAWLTIRFLRKRAQRDAEDNRGAAFLNVRGLIKEDDEKNGDEPLPRYGCQFHLCYNALTRIFYPPIIAIFTASKAMCSRGHT